MYHLQGTRVPNFVHLHWHSSFVKILISLTMAEPSWSNHLHMFHLGKLSYWTVGIQLINFGGTDIQTRAEVQFHSFLYGYPVFPMQWRDFLFPILYSWTPFLKDNLRRQSKDGGGIGWGDHFLPHKFIKRSFEYWATSTKQLLNAGGGHQAPRKADHSFWKEVGHNIKGKNRDKTFRGGDPSWEGSRERGEVPTQ